MRNRNWVKIIFVFIITVNYLIPLITITVMKFAQPPDSYLLQSDGISQWGQILGTSPLSCNPRMNQGEIISRAPKSASADRRIFTAVSLQKHICPTELAFGSSVTLVNRGWLLQSFAFRYSRSFSFFPTLTLSKVNLIGVNSWSPEVVFELPGTYAKEAFFLSRSFIVSEFSGHLCRRCLWSQCLCRIWHGHQSRRAVVKNI